MTNLTDLINGNDFDTPWGVTGSMNAPVRSFDGTDISPFRQEDVAEWVHAYSSGSGWDGDCVAVGRLSDGRWFAWESWWGPTGSGFHEDAYGGDVEVIVARTYVDLVRWMTQEALNKIDVER